MIKITCTLSDTYWYIEVKSGSFTMTDNIYLVKISEGVRLRGGSEIIIHNKVFRFPVKSTVIEEDFE